MCHIGRQKSEAKIAQLGERMTEDHKVRCSIHLLGAFLFSFSTSHFEFENECITIGVHFPEMKNIFSCTQLYLLTASCLKAI